MSTYDFDATYSALTGEHIGGIYIPMVDADSGIDAEGYDVLIDGRPDNLCDEWRALTGYTRQYGYRGCIMHPSETMPDDAIREAVREAGGDVFALVAVENACECLDAEECAEWGRDHGAAGWTVIYRAAA